MLQQRIATKGVKSGVGRCLLKILCLKTNKLATSPQPDNCPSRAITTHCLYFFNPFFRLHCGQYITSSLRIKIKKNLHFLGLEYAVCTKISVSVFKSYWAGLESYCCHALSSINRWCYNTYLELEPLCRRISSSSISISGDSVGLQGS